MIYLSLEQILFIHEKGIARYGGTQGIRDRELLELAVVRPQMSAFGKDAYPTLYLKSAALLHSLVQNHPFLDGNKRTGFGSMHLMLLRNGFDLSSSSAAEVQMCLDVAKGILKVDQIADWIKKYTRQK